MPNISPHGGYLGIQVFREKTDAELSLMNRKNKEKVVNEKAKQKMQKHTTAMEQGIKTPKAAKWARIPS